MLRSQELAKSQPIPVNSAQLSKVREFAGIGWIFTNRCDRDIAISWRAWIISLVSADYINRMSPLANGVTFS